MVELLKNPDGTVKIKIEARGQTPAPSIVNNHGGADLRRLYDCFNLSPIPHAESSSFRKEHINSALIVAVAALEETVTTKNKFQAVLCRAASK